MLDCCSRPCSSTDSDLKNPHRANPSCPTRCLKEFNPLHVFCCRLCENLCSFTDAASIFDLTDPPIIAWSHYSTSPQPDSKPSSAKNNGGLDDDDDEDDVYYDDQNYNKTYEPKDNNGWSDGVTFSTHTRKIRNTAMGKTGSANSIVHSSEVGASATSVAAATQSTPVPVTPGTLLPIIPNVIDVELAFLLDATSDNATSVGCASFYKLVANWLIAALILGTYVYSFIYTGNPDFLLAYLTYWAMTASVLYIINSFLNSCGGLLGVQTTATTPSTETWVTNFYIKSGFQSNLAVTTTTSRDPDWKGPVVVVPDSWRIRMTWILFTVALHTEVMVSVLRLRHH
jgi:hypothetical protein